MNKTDIIARAEQALDTMRPYLAADGGNIEIVALKDEGVLEVKLLGNCETCPMSFMTMKAGVEQSIMSSVREITSVKALNMVESDS